MAAPLEFPGLKESNAAARHLMGQMAEGPVAGNISRKYYAKVVGFGCVAPSAAGRVVALRRSVMPGPQPVRWSRDWRGDALPWTGCDTLPRAREPAAGDPPLPEARGGLGKARIYCRSWRFMRQLPSPKRRNRARQTAARQGQGGGRGSDRTTDRRGDRTGRGHRPVVGAHAAQGLDRGRDGAALPSSCASWPRQVLATPCRALCVRSAGSSARCSPCMVVRSRLASADAYSALRHDDPADAGTPTSPAATARFTRG